MGQLNLCTVGPQDTAFLQYIPACFHPLLDQEGTVCVGAVYNGASCGVALAERYTWGKYYLRYIFVDPKARLCGLGTYLLRGLLGRLQGKGAKWVKAVYDPSMLEGERQILGILERAGFSQPEPISTNFSTRLGDIPELDIPLPPSMAVYSAADAPPEVQEAYIDLLEGKDLPAYADVRGMEGVSAELCSFCAVEGKLSGIFLIGRKADGICLEGLYVLPAFRGGRTAVALISRSIRAGKAILPPETEVWTSAISRESFSLCDKLLRLGSRAKKETEFSCIYQF